MCKSARLHKVLDLGSQPHSDSFPTAEDLRDAEVHYPLRLVSCLDCGLLQIDYFVDPVRLYQQDYLYVSSTTETGKKHYGDMARDICGKFSTPQGSLVVDIGSNVGVLLGGFKEAGMTVLGVDPAANIAAQAVKNGIPTIADFFSEDTARGIKKEHGSAAIITGTNVFAHLHELDDAVAGMRELLAPEGVIVVEAPHATTLIEHLEYDTIYHQHIGYLSVRPMKQYFKRMGLELFDVEEVQIHGGSLRYFVGHPGIRPVQPAVESMIAHEESRGTYDTRTLALFSERVEKQRQKLLEILVELKKQSKTIAAVSTPAKGNTLLNYCHIDKAFIDFATERNPLKIGRHTPGTHIPILADDELLNRGADYALLLAWNFAPEIMRNNEEFAKKGGKFILPIPEPRITP